MQFIRNGPDVPERLLQAHEDGQVVFFCGAGISYPAGLPGFKGLVEQLYADLLTTPPSPVQQVELDAGRFDAALGLLEGDIVGGREKVRWKLANILLHPKAPKATETHEAMLTLGTSRDDRTRLITTNFDCLFEKVITKKSLNVERFKAPLLPIPKKNWDGLVYLHGLLSKKPKPGKLDRLVISSSDFGLAYLRDGWASRFVSELFRNYTVCFVGYSIDDPVMRYMTDTLAADHLLGESSREMFAFGCYSNGKRRECAEEWEAKSVTPILYQQDDNQQHAYLHKTLRAWAKTYQDAVAGKERIVKKYAKKNPLKSTKEDDFVGRVLWALSDPSGLPAKCFAEMNSVPSLDWLKPISDERYEHADLDRFGVLPTATVDRKLKFSLLRRPSPYKLAPWITVVDEGACRSGWDKVIGQLANWLIRHLNDPDLLLWLVERGGQLHNTLVWKIEGRLNHLAELEQDGNEAELARIRAGAPNAIPGPLMRKLWRLLLAGRVNSESELGDCDLYSWCKRFQQEGLTTTLRLELREILAPRVSLQKFIRPLHWEIRLSDGYVHGDLEDLLNDERWIATLPDLLSDFSGLLRDALDLMCELGGADHRRDPSYVYQPSISGHPQNRGRHDWTALIDLTRDAWLATAKQSPERARLSAEAWTHVPYPLFHRLAFFAAARPDVISPRRALDWLLADRWLWAIETRREAIRLLVALAPRLDDAMQTEVERVILAGPPREMFRDDIEPEDWKEYQDWWIWLRLAKLDEVNALRTSDGKERLRELSAQYPDWQLAPDQRDEFFGWVETSWEGREGQSVATPRHRRELVEWLRQYPNMESFQPDDWRERCRDDFPTTAGALCALAREGVWPTGRWVSALRVWSEKRHAKRSWCYLGPVLAKVPERKFQEIADGVSSWLQFLFRTLPVKVLEGHKPLLFTLAHRILDLDYRDEVFFGDGDLPTHAINHPVGCVTEALLNWWYRQSLEDGQGLPEDLKHIFTKLCDTQIDKFRPGRVNLARYITALFRADQDWTTKHLLPLFKWQSSEDEEHPEASSAWCGFLCSAHLYLPLMEEPTFKSAFLETAIHYTTLGKYSRQYAWLLASAALNLRDTFTHEELAQATAKLPQEGLTTTINILAKTLEIAGDQRKDYWENRVEPYLRKMWPKTRNKLSPAISRGLGSLCIAAGDEFPEAFDLLRDWLALLDRPDFLVRALYGTADPNLCREFPGEVLEFLSQIINDQIRWLPRDLGACLKTIHEANPALEEDPKYQKLMTYARQHGID